MFNINTLLSVFDEKGTLMKWLQKVEAALNGATLNEVEVIPVNETQIKLRFNFEDDTHIDSETLTLPRGAQGIQGIQGVPGQNGADGKDGVSPKITIVRVDTLPAGSAATVTNIGTETDVKLVFGIPQGATGARGADGVNGQDGADGVSPTINIARVDTLPTGSPATVTNTGTETDVRLVFGIPTGPQGATGAQGETGAAGANGKDGNGLVAIHTVGYETTADGYTVTNLEVVTDDDPPYTVQVKAKNGADGGGAIIYPISLRIPVTIKYNEAYLTIVAYTTNPNLPMEIPINDFYSLMPTSRYIIATLKYFTPPSVTRIFSPIDIKFEKFDNKYTMFFSGMSQTVTNEISFYNDDDGISIPANQSINVEYLAK